MDFLLPNPKSFFELDDGIKSGLGALYREEDVRYGCDHICIAPYYIAPIYAKVYQNRQRPGLCPGLAGFGRNVPLQRILVMSEKALYRL